LAEVVSIKKLKALTDPGQTKKATIFESNQRSQKIISETKNFPKLIFPGVKSKERK
jgi:hypothetical protein